MPLLTMLDTDRRVLTASLLRVLKASESLHAACLAPTGPRTTWAAVMGAAPMNGQLAWDGNIPFEAARASIARTTASARQHGVALYELARSVREFSVPLATVTRGSVEAYGRVFWLLSAEAPEEFFARYASLEYFDMEFPEKHGSSLRRLPLEEVATRPVDAYRERVQAWAAQHRLVLTRRGPTALATEVLARLYPDGMDARVVYSGLAATAHGQGWATANFFDFKANSLRRDDKMLIDYCMYVVETTRIVDDAIIRRFGATQADSERWSQTNAQVSEALSAFITPTAGVRKP